MNEKADRIIKALEGIDFINKSIYVGNVARWQYVALIRHYHYNVTRPDYILPMNIIWDIVRPKKYMVIGVLFGTTESYVMTQTGHRPDLMVVCDLDDPSYNVNRNNFTYVYENITGPAYGNYKGELVIIRTDSTKTKLLPMLGKHDLIFVDGAHTKPAVTADLESAYKSLAEGGIILVHDINPVPACIPVREGYFEWLEAHPDMAHYEVTNMFGHLGVAWQI